MTERTYIGRRKSAVARVRLRRGSGQVELNGRPLEEYFTTEKQRAHILEPLAVLDQVGQWDIDARLDGGGMTGQAGALRLGIARAMAGSDADWRRELKEAGLLTRDAREVERKKYGLKKARKAPQYSKR